MQQKSQNGSHCANCRTRAHKSQPRVFLSASTFEGINVPKHQTGNETTAPLGSAFNRLTGNNFLFSDVSLQLEEAEHLSLCSAHRLQQRFSSVANVLGFTFRANLTELVHGKCHLASARKKKYIAFAFKQLIFTLVSPLA